MPSSVPPAHHGDPPNVDRGETRPERPAAPRDRATPTTPHGGSDSADAWFKSSTARVYAPEQTGRTPGGEHHPPPL
jgi:hypothetical protein